jgi:hypothetical protein
MSIDEMVGVTARIAEKLKSAGVTTVQKFANASAEELLAIPGIGPKTIEKLRETAEGTIAELEKALEELIDKENEERIRAQEEEKPLFDESVMSGEDEVEEEKLTEEALFSDDPAAAEEESGEGVEAEPDEDVELGEEGEEIEASETDEDTDASEETIEAAASEPDGKVGLDEEPVEAEVSEPDEDAEVDEEAVSTDESQTEERKDSPVGE